MLFHNLEQFQRINKDPHFHIIRNIESVLIKNYLTKSSNPFLDLGCGDGRFTEKLDLRNVHGIDIDNKALKKIEKNIYDSYQFANADNLPYKDNYFSTIYSNCALEHMNNIRKILTEIYRTLKMRGEFIFTVPTPFFFDVVTADKFLTKLNLNSQSIINEYNSYHHHVNIFDLSQWRQLLEESNLVLEKYNYYLPDIIGKFVARMDILTTIRNKKTKFAYKTYNFLFNSGLNFKLVTYLNEYFKNPFVFTTGTHLILKAKKIR